MPTQLDKEDPKSTRQLQTRYTEWTRASVEGGYRDRALKRLAAHIKRRSIDRTGLVLAIGYRQAGAVCEALPRLFPLKDDQDSAPPSPSSIDEAPI